MLKTHTTNNQAVPSVALNNAGQFVLSWSSYAQDGSGWGIYFKMYVVPIADDNGKTDPKPSALSVPPSAAVERLIQTVETLPPEAMTQLIFGLQPRGVHVDVVWDCGKLDCEVCPSKL